MSYQNTKFRLMSQILLVLFLTNNIAPTLQFAFADSTQFYVDATGGSDLSDGLTPATAWQTVTKVNSTSLLQGDTVSFICTDTWNEVLTINNTNGGIWLPITVNSYGTWCAMNKPSIDTINITNSSKINIDSMRLVMPIVWSSINISWSNMINLTNNTITNGSGICLSIMNSTGSSVTTNIFSGCGYGMSVSASEVNIIGNSFSTISEDAVNIMGTLPVTVSQNIFTNIAQNAVIYGQDTAVTQNVITNSCSTGWGFCAAIKNNPTLSWATVTSTVTQNTISWVGSGISWTGSYGILSYNVAGTNISSNSVVNAENALRVIDAHNLSITSNTLLTSRARSVLVTQENAGRTYTNTFTANTILQKNPDYPYIEMKDEVAGSNLAASFLTPSGNTLYPNYKPNTSYVRSVNFWEFTKEYTKNTLNQFDASVVKFEYFAYKPYTNTGSFATANLLTNPDFTTDPSGWSVSADTGLSPTLSYNPVGSYLGGSATIIPAWGAPDRIWTTNDAILSITAGQTYLVSWYVRSSSGNVNLRGFLHQSGSYANVYSDRIAETFASSTGWLFSFYITVNTTASDANLSFETSNQSVNYEIDSLSIRRMNAVVKNTNVNEVLIFSNTGSAPYDPACPGGVPCFAYVDGVNVPIGWPISVPAYMTRFVLWNNSPNVLNTPACTLNISAGSSPTGQPVTVDWTTTNSDSQILNYATYTGSANEIVSASWSITFIPPYDTVTTISLNTINDIWPKQCSLQVTTTNTAPNIYPTTTTGSEDSPQINGTLSGVDLNPGDSIFFEAFGGNMTLNGTVNIDSSGSFQYFPNANYCWTDDFSFRAADQLWSYADPVNHTIQVGCVNDVPVAINNTGSAIAGIPLMINVLANDTDVDTPYEIQTFTIVSFSAPANGTLLINSNQLRYTPNLGFSGTEVFSYRMTDQSGALSNSGVVTVSVTIANTPPNVTGTGYTFNEDTLLSRTLTWSDNEGDMLTYTASVLPTNWTLVLFANGSFTYTPNSNYFWSDSFDFRANDGAISSAPATVSLTINSVGDAPIAINDNYTLNQDTTLYIPVRSNDNDVDSTVLTFTGYINPSNGVISISGTWFDYTPNTGYIGWDSFSYQLIDELNLTSNIATVTLNVTSTNTAPTANSGSFSINEDIILSGALTGTDPQGSTLTYIIDTLPAQGTLSVSGTWVFIYTPATNYFWSDSFVFHVSDGILSSSGVMVNIMINSVNDIPVANTLSFTSTGNSMASSGYFYTSLLTASDIESVGLSFTTATLPINGLLTLSSTGVFTYLPALWYIGPDSFTFTAFDWSATSPATTVNITIISNGVIVPQVLDHFSITSPSTAYSGQAFSITVQAKDSSNVTILWYTGSIVFSSSTDTGATLPASGSPIAFTLPDSGTKTFVNAVSFSKTGTLSFRIQDTLMSISGTTLVSVSITPPSTPSSGGSWGGGQSTPGVSYNIVSAVNSGALTNPIVNPVVPVKDPVFNSAPVASLETVFVMQDPSGLLGQLFLTNRYMGSSPVVSEESDSSESNTQQQAVASTIIDSLDSVILDEYEWPMILRQIARLFIQEASWSDDPVALYDYGIGKIELIQAPNDSRLAATREYILRIFEQQKRRYEEQVYRTNYSRFEDTMNSASEEIENIDV